MSTRGPHGPGADPHVLSHVNVGVIVGGILGISEFSNLDVHADGLIRPRFSRRKVARKRTKACVENTYLHHSSSPSLSQRHIGFRGHRCDLHDILWPNPAFVVAHALALAHFTSPILQA